MRGWIKKTRKSCRNSGSTAIEHFVGANKLSKCDDKSNLFGKENEIRRKNEYENRN